MRIFLCIPLIILNVFGFQEDDWDIPGFDCGDCHGSQGWTVLDLSGFNHQQTNFQLEGSHQFQPCNSCHTGDTVEDKHQFQRESQCSSCHLDVHLTSLGDECTQCHGMDSWQVTPQTFDHNLTQFSLLGAHASVSCQECHTEGGLSGYSQTPTDCYSCHRTDYDLTDSPSHTEAGINTECTICHSIQTLAWSPSTFDHDTQTDYPLTGAHRDSQCSECHTGTFSGTDDACWSCHQQEFFAVGTNLYPDAPVHVEGVYDTDCSICHTGTITWEGGYLDHAQTDYPLTGAHEVTECSVCHREGIYELPLTCEECHVPGQIAETNFETAEYDHTTHNIINVCEQCHTTTTWEQSIFDHLNFTTSGCDQCHLIDFQETTEPDHIALGYPPSDCEYCHSTTEWDPGIFEHQVSSACATCHLTDYQNTTNPVHLPEEGYSDENCEECHTSTETWLGASFDHSLTAFPLTGAHETTECAQCHGQGVYTLPQTCEECHVPGQIAETNFETAEYDHTTHNIINVCEQCHTTTTWEQSIFDHLNFTTSGCDQCHLIDFQETTEPDHIALGYPPSDCEYCHSTTEWDPGIFEHQVSSACATCHLTDYQNTTNPVHLPEEGYSDENCEECHTSTETWLGASFDHSLTAFPLTGAHETTECAQCHGQGVYTLPQTCEECHSPGQLASTNYETAEYDHTTHNIINECAQCHTTGAWTESIFDHVNVSETSCEYCHQPEYITSASPPHNNGNIRDQCALCHSSGNWNIDNFPHSVEQTDYQLNGLHLQVQCQNCHLGDQYQGTENTCQSSGCHLQDYQTATPDHQVYGYPLDHCTECHVETGWSPDIYSHGLTLLCQNCHMPDYNNATDPQHTEAGGFSLSCENCHLTVDTWDGATYNHEGIVSGCFDCHSQDYYSTTSPNHEQAGYSTECNLCHTSFTDWSEAQIDHSFYPLSDDHTNVTCNECHSQPEFQPSCWSCHETDFFDEHTAGESTLCWNCHTTFDWEESTFTHQFPINPPHQDEVNESCESCHTGSNTVEFTCFNSGGCHSTTSETSEHCEDGPQDCESCNGMTYPYSGVTSQDCYTCHPNGDEDDCEGDDDRSGGKAPKDNNFNRKPWKSKLF